MKRRILGTAAAIIIAFAGGFFYNSRTSAAPAASQSSSAVAQSASLPASTGGSTSSTAADGKLQYYFPRADEAPEPVLAGIIGSAKTSVDTAIYSITDKRISDALIAAKERGVAVRVISDKDQSKSKYQKSLLDSLKKAGIPVKLNSHSGIMHLKVTIVDKSVATTGSFNYTKSAETENDEVFVVLRDPAAARDFDTEFSSMWADTKNYSDF